ncbi:MAG: hypothetical protein JWN52_2610 [Actinomycetia bacterium]|nr:hypothetical protein [Actinomycetes bacterium]
MKYRATFIAGAAVGYVLGTRAGKERYEQIKRASRRVAENPRLQETAGVLRAQVGDMAGTARDKVSGTLHDRFGDKVDKIPGLHREPEKELPPQPPPQATPTHH